MMGLVTILAPAALAQEGAGGQLPGLVQVQSDRGVNETFGKIEEGLQANPAVSIVARVDHTANAQSVGLDLRPTQLVVFGNPMLGTQLMQQNQTVGIDLPQKFLTYEDAEGQTRAAYNSPEYLARRHGLQGTEEPLNKIGNALSKLAGNAAGGAADTSAADAAGIEAGEGLVAVESSFSVDETFSRLEEAVQSQEPLSVIASVDHAANASSVDLDLRPTKLLVFGNPMLGTQLMQEAQTVGIDLPQKFLVYEDAEGRVFVVYNDPYYIAARHGIEGQDEVLQKISGALDKLATTATAQPMPETGGASLLIPAAALLLAAGTVLALVARRRTY
jgi:uncharacterized protein (DUF302 family)